MDLLKSSWKALFWAVFIFVISAIPGQVIPPYKIWNADKIVHSFIYFILTILLIAAWNKQKQFILLKAKAKLLSFCFAVTYGGIIEILQENCFTNRSGNIPDFIANSLGAAIAVVSIHALFKIPIIKKML